ncbi:hypothetical protein [Euryhalocaulis caribicus]|uniref:hypothetical protein n=1 Tax=Euryhalocaulis caribicus TaxID=1161401 RepID=UPI001268BC7F|nr:hypothetical protein [Euryhalocaulis caribicus]
MAKPYNKSQFEKNLTVSDDGEKLYWNGRSILIRPTGLAWAGALAALFTSLAALVASIVTTIAFFSGN